MMVKSIVTILFLTLGLSKVALSSDEWLQVLSPSFQTHVASADNEGNAVFQRIDDTCLRRNRFSSSDPKLKSWEEPKIVKTDFIDLGRNISTDGATLAGEVNIVEIVIVVDKDFGDNFNHDYNRIVDYLAVYFWDINMRYKSLPGVDISFRVNGLLIMENAQAQPFIEDARNHEGKPDFNQVLPLFSSWIFQQRGWLVPHDLAPLMMGADVAWGGGLAYMDAACWVDHNGGKDIGVSVWNDGGDWGSLTVGAHELGHNLGAPHDDDCPEAGFIMGGGNNDRRYFFSECSNQRVSAFVNSNSASCLRATNGFPTTPIDPNFSSPKAPDTSEQCRRRRRNPDAWVDEQDINCKETVCKWRDANDPNLIWMQGFSPVDNTLCPNGGRCFRGRCRQESQLLRNEQSGKCLITLDLFGHTVQARLGPCPSAKDKTPLTTIDVLDGPNGKMLSTPYLEDRNKVNADRCFYTGNVEGGAIWTDTCSTDNPWHGWDFRTIEGGQFQLVHRVTGRCAVPASGEDGSEVVTVTCSGGNPGMSWALTNGQ